MGLYWNVWIICLTPSYEAKITSEMVNLGFEVSPLGEGSKVNSNETSTNSGAMLAYRICDPKGHQHQKLNDMISGILSKNKMFYFGVIVSEATQYCCWRSSNIPYPSTKPAAVQEKKILN